MPFTSQRRSIAIITFASCVLLLAGSNVTAQTTSTGQPPPQKPQEDVVRVYTELVQTDVMVFDKQGRFVNGLTKENFELRIDGKPRPIQAFEQVTAGSDEETQLAAARGATTINLKRPAPLDRGRIIFFYIDDFHMNLEGVVAARKVINNFLDKQMGQNDQVAITSATGQIGFLQQLTTDRMVLHKALERVTPGNYSVRDIERPPMSEYQAMLIERGGDGVMFDYFVTETIRQNPGLNRLTAGQIVRGRAQALQSQAERVNSNTLSGLESLVRSARNLPGRKLVFFLSGGFLIDTRRSSVINKLRNVTTAAANSGVVIYSMDTRGLVASLQDASTEAAFDPGGQLAGATSTFGELSATQDPLNALAVDTGGKALFNTNDLTQGLAPAIKETSTYYLLAWKPDAETSGRFRQLEVKLVNRPDLSVRVRKGFFDVDPAEPAVEAKKKPKEAPPVKTAAATLREVVTAAYPERALPISMSVDYYDVPEKGSTLSTSINLPGEFLSFGQQPDGKIQAIVDLSGVYYDEKGKPQANFLERITTTAPTLEATKGYNADIIFNYPAKLPPGLYNVRAAARDEKSGRVGSAHAWIEVPDLTKKQLTMSSVLLGERMLTVTSVSDNNDSSPVALSASHRFKRDSTLRFLVFVYNMAPSPADQKPDVAVQVQVLRDDQPVITTAVRKLNTEGVTDMTRLPYAAEMPMSDLGPGRYVLQVSVIDRVAKQSTTRKTHFDVY